MQRGRRRSQNYDPFGRRGFKRRRSRLRSAGPSSAVKQLTICLKMHPHPSCHSSLADSSLEGDGFETPVPDRLVPLAEREQVPQRSRMKALNCDQFRVEPEVRTHLPPAASQARSVARARRSRILIRT